MGNPIARLAARRRLRVAGLMSGTSADGVDAAIVDLGGRRARVLAFATYPYPAALRRQVLALSGPGAVRVDDVCHLNFALGEVFASALVRLAARSGIPLGSIDLVGSHGQTIRHLPEGRRFRPSQPKRLLRRSRLGGRRVRSTLQIGEPSVIAERTGITTVADFRPRDVAAGGSGAPLVPYADWVLFRHPRRGRAIQNLGGIANVTWLPPGAALADVLAFDTGPGNMMIDRAAHLATRGRARYDAGGRIAARGRVDERLLAELLRHPYLARRPPKSTGRETFGAPLTDALWRRARRRLGAADFVATLTAFTAASIADAYRRFLPRPIDEVILCGGGARNRTLVAHLGEALRPARVLVTDALGLSADAKEAVSFAILAYATVRGTANNVPSATGARRPVVLGKVVPGSR